jgi:hypothetical protein
MADLSGASSAAAAARKAVRDAVASGRLVRASHCSDCGTDQRRIQAHHHRGYSPEHALDIVWLCTKCHYAADSAAHASSRIALRSAPFTAERRAKIGLAARGRRVSSEQRARISQALKGREFSPEHRANISAAITGRALSPEHRLKISALRRGKPLSIEHRAKLVGQSAGERNPKAKLSADAVRSIRTLHAHGAGSRELAERYRVNISTIHRITTGRSWSHIV